MTAHVPDAVDAHVHLYDTAALRYPWLDAVPHIKAPFLYPDYAAAVSGTSVRQFVFMEAGAHHEDAAAEVRWVAEHCANRGVDGPELGAIVAQIHVERGAAVDDELTPLLEVETLKGVRRILARPFLEDPEIATGADFIEGVRRIGRCGLSFDVGAPSGQLPKVLALARACVDVTFVLDHLGMPTGAEIPFDAWCEQLRELGRLPNVYCKISGLLQQAGSQPPAEALAPYISEAVEGFGFDRVIFGSDYPVHNAAGGVSTWLDTVLDVLSGSSTDEHDRLFARNARSVYRIASPRPVAGAAADGAAEHQRNDYDPA